MADINPILPGGAVPPKPGEASKVQPKKETVRINLPPKPSAAPTIKLPTLPPGGPSAGAPGIVPPPPPGAAPKAAPARPAAAAAPVAGSAVAASAAAQRPVAQRPALAPARAALSVVDVGLAIGAAVAALFAIGTTIYCMTLFT